MKKFLVVLVILAVVVTGVFADPVPSAPQSKDLKIFGVIEVGDVNLKVVKTPAEDMLVIKKLLNLF